MRTCHWVSVFIFSLLSSLPAFAAPIVLLTDFGRKEGAVPAIYGVIDQVDPGLKVVDLSHEIPVFNIWEASYRLIQVAPYWRPGTVFVSVVDPGVGTSRRSVVAKTRSGHYFVTPDNGTLTLVDEVLGVEEVRVIDETLHRRPGSEDSHTFHGRDIFAYLGAQLAAGRVRFEDVGERLDPKEIIRIPYPHAKIEGRILSGTIPVLDVQFGNVWTNIPEALAREFGWEIGKTFQVRIFNGSKRVFSQEIVCRKTFGDVAPQQHLLYFNSLGNLAAGTCKQSLAKKARIGYGPDWRIEIEKIEG